MDGTTRKGCSNAEGVMFLYRDMFCGLSEGRDVVRTQIVVAFVLCSVTNICVLIFSSEFRNSVENKEVRLLPFEGSA